MITKYDKIDDFEKSLLAKKYIYFKVKAIENARKYFQRKMYQDKL